MQISLTLERSLDGCPRFAGVDDIILNVSWDVVTLWLPFHRHLCMSECSSDMCRCGTFCRLNKPFIGMQ